MTIINYIINILHAVIDFRFLFQYLLLFFKFHYIWLTCRCCLTNSYSVYPLHPLFFRLSFSIVFKAMLFSSVSRILPISLCRELFSTFAVQDWAFRPPATLNFLYFQFSWFSSRFFLLLSFDCYFHFIRVLSRFGFLYCSSQFVLF